MEQFVCISYAPLLTGPTGLVNPDDLKSIDESLPSNAADGCLWVNDEGVPSPIFAYERAIEIADHLTAWSEKHPDEWFKVYVIERHDRYVIVLFPELNKSLERWRMTLTALCGVMLPEDAKITMFTKPLYFVSAKRTAFDLVMRAGLPDNIKIGLIETSKLDKELNEIESGIKWLGTFRRGDPHAIEKYIDSLFTPQK